MAKKQKIGDFLIRIKRPIELIPNKDYKLVTIKMNHKGVVLRGEKKGALIKSKMYEVKKGDFILSGIDARNGAFGIVPEELDGAIVTNDFWYFKIDENIISKRLFLELTATTWFDEICNRGSDGTTQRIRLQKDKFFTQEISLPEGFEQEKLLSKLLNFKDNQASFISEIQIQKSLLTQLKQSILQEAIQGKLTRDWRAQNPEFITGENSAATLLDSIQAEKARLIKDKNIKKEKPLPPIEEEEIPFELPENWVWCRLQDLFIFIDYRGKTPTKLKEGIRLLTAKNVRAGYLNLNPEEFLSKSEYKERMTRGFPKNGDILFTTEAPLGNAALLDIEEKEISTGQRLITFQSPLDNFDNRSILNFILSPFFQNSLQKKSSGVTATGIKASRLRMVPFPLPPLHEQKAITEKIEVLMEKWNVLEQEITESEQHVQMLMQVVLKEAFEVEEISEEPQPVVK